MMQKSSVLTSERAQGKSPVILLGLKPQGLFLLRELSKAGFAVHAVDSTKTPAFRSKYGCKYVVSSDDELLSLLSELHQRFGSGTRCYVSSGALLDCVVRKMPQLYDLCEVYPRPLPSVALLLNKMSTYAAAKELGISCPETFTLEQVDLACEFCSNGRKLIAKWNREFTGTASTPGFKTLVIDKRSTCTELKETLSEEEQKNVILQHFIDNDQQHNISYQGYFVDGVCVASFLAQQLRQFPMGITSYLRECDGRGVEEIAQKANRLFARMRYTGFAEAEFKWDDTFTVPYLLEVNPRAHGLISALKAKYPGLARVLTLPTCNEPLQGVARRIEWANIMRDLRSVIQGFRRHKSISQLSLGLVSWAKPKFIDGFDWRDMRPFLIQPVQALLDRRGHGR